MSFCTACGQKLAAEGGPCDACGAVKARSQGEDTSGKATTRKGGGPSYGILAATLAAVAVPIAWPLVQSWAGSSEPVADQATESRKRLELPELQTDIPWTGTVTWGVTREQLTHAFRSAGIELQWEGEDGNWVGLLPSEGNPGDIARRFEFFQDRLFQVQHTYERTGSPNITAVSDSYLAAVPDAARETTSRPETGFSSIAAENDLLRVAVTQMEDLSASYTYRPIFRLVEEEAAARAREATEGKPSDFQSLFEMSKTGMTIGQRYQVRACMHPSSGGSVNVGPRIGRSGHGCAEPWIHLYPDFDSVEHHKVYLRLPARVGMYTIVVSMSPLGRVVLHRVE